MSIKIDKTTVDSITKELSNGAENDVRTGYLLGKIESNDKVITGVYVPEQESNNVRSIVKDEEKYKALQALKNNNQTILGVAKYHASFAVFEAATTFRERTGLGLEGMPGIALVVNRKGDYEIFE